MTEIVPIDESLVDVAARSLAAAFADDPLMRWQSRGSKDLAESLQHGFRAMIRIGLRKDEPLMHITADHNAVAVWHDIDDWKDSLMDSLRLAPAFVRSVGIRMDRVIRTQMVVEKAHPNEPHYFASLLGTRPTHRGQGLAAAVMTPVLERCDREGVPAYLESSNSENVGFYARLGFEAWDPFDLPKGAPTVTPMWRNPRT